MIDNTIMKMNIVSQFVLLWLTCHQMKTNMTVFKKRKMSRQLPS